MPRAGKALEQFVEHLERALAADENISIQSPGFLRDKVTGELREFDVVVTFKTSHHSMVTSIECKDWKRPLDVPLIEAYQTKCEHCDINSKVIVSPVGFTDAALRKGKFLGVRCLKLGELGELSWVRTPSIGVRWRSALVSNWQIEAIDPDKNLTDIQNSDFELCFPIGLPFHQVYLDKLLADAIKNDKSPDCSPGTTWKTRYKFPNHAVRLLHKPTGKIFDCTLSVETTLRMESANEELKFFEYEEIEGGKIARGATATIKVPGMSAEAKVILLEQSDGARRLVVINPGEIQSATLQVQKEPDKHSEND